MANLAAFGTVTLMLSFCACAVAFFAPMWMKFLADDTTQGLWGRCPPAKACIWFQEENFALQSHWPGWYRGCQSLFTLGLLLQLVTLVIAIFHVSCQCCAKTRNLLTVISFLLLGSLLLMLLSISLFAGMAYNMDDYKTSQHSSVSVLDWAYFVAVAGILANALAVILFYIQGYQVARQYDGYA